MDIGKEKIIIMLDDYYFYKDCVEKLEKVKKLMKESYDGDFEELWNGLVEVLS